jgi:endonuclease/exonuclease/phosphatase (EEP) superfamily protein YafD
MSIRALVAWTLVAAGAAWVVVRTFGLERGYPMVPLMAYTPLAIVAAVAAAVLATLLRQRAAAVCAAVLASVLVVSVAPRALGGPSRAEGGSGPRLRVLTANLYQQPGTAAGLVAIVRETRPDVLSVQELTPSVERALDAAGLAELLPERVLATRPGGFGSGLYSRLPLERRAAAPRSALAAASARLQGAPRLELYAVHPPAPLRAAAMPAWRAGLRALPAATRRGALRILAGDFNATLDHAEFRDLLDRGYEDAAAETGAGLRATWPAGRRFPPPVTIDHVLADARCGVRGTRVLDVPRSDHRAVLAELELPRG